jgi:acylphosphatase
MQADRLALRGVARNLTDGSVEVIAYGEAAAVQELSQWLRRGPPTAQVQAVRELELGNSDPDLGEGGIGPGFAVE